MFCCAVNFGGIVDPDNRITRRMKYQQRLIQIFDPLFLVLGSDIVEELLLDNERAPAEAYRRLALLVEKLSDTGAGSNGAPMVATVLTPGISPAAASTAAPPRLWPIRMPGAS